MRRAFGWMGAMVLWLALALHAWEPLRLSTQDNVSLAASHLEHWSPSGWDAIPPQASWTKLPDSLFQSAVSLHFGGVRPPVLLRLRLEVPQSGRWWFYTELRTPELMELLLDGRDLGVVGTGLPFAERVSGSLALSFPLDLDSGTHTLYMKASSAQGDCLLEMLAVPEALYPRVIQTHALYSGLVVGFLVLVLIIALYLWNVVRKAEFGWYAGYVFFGLGWVTTKIGVGAAWFWPDTPSMNLVTPTLLNHLALACFFLFLRGLLQMRVHLPWAARIMVVAVVFEVLSALLGPMAIVFPVLHRWILATCEPEVIQLPLMVLILSSLVWRSWKRDRLALQILLATLPLVGVVLLSSWLELGSVAAGANEDTWIAIGGALLENALTTLVLMRELRRRELARIELENNFHLRLLQQTDEYRSMIARELHDDLGQRLVALRLRLSLGVGLSSAEARGVAQDVASLLTDLRTLSHHLHPHTMKTGSLAVSLRDLCQKMSISSGVQILCDCELAPSGLDAERETHLYRIAQEALQNAVRHAHASRIAVAMFRHGSVIQLSISDNGKGMVMRQETDGIGIANMQARARALGSTLNIVSAPERGTVIRLEISL